MSDATCAECPDPTWARGLCHSHYGFHYVRGTLPPWNNVTPASERFWRHVHEAGPDECWEWTGWCDRAGYGRFRPTSKQSDPKTPAHRFAYELFVGPIPDGLELDHLCRNKSCVNPGHLEPVTAQVNSRRRSAALPPKTHCRQGHPFDEANTSIQKDGSRKCRACDRERHRKKAA